MVGYFEFCFLSSPAKSWASLSASLALVSRRVYKEDLGMKQTLDGSKAVAEQEKVSSAKMALYPITSPSPAR